MVNGNHNLLCLRREKKRVRVGCNYALDPSAELSFPCLTIKRNENDRGKKVS
jgi:hypothetical protein